MATLHAGLPPAGLSDGEFIGPYRVLRKIGTGGMAEVFKAIRDDGVHSRSVAVKVIRNRWLGEAALEQRFRTEREILASLEHPGIARLLDGGVTAQGAPYVVMEFVEGSNLGDYCQREGVTLADKLRLFTELCEAVEYAHRNLIVHRDLKPNNVLVTVEGHIKLLDFGIAKLLRPEVWRGGVAVTTAADRLATPEFASPEQLRGEAITTASDVYSLGILLHYILTGKLPYNVSNLEWDEAVRIVSEVETASLSDPGIPRDLDAIVRMATRKDPVGRYASVSHFREDVERHLASRPVRARRGEWSYPIGRFMRRHAWAVSLAVVLVLVLAAAAGSLAFLARRLEQERDTARATTFFMAGLFDAADPLGGRQRTVRDILDDGARKLATLRDQPRVQAALSENIGDVYRQLGEYKLARPLAEQAVDLYLQLDGPRSLDAARNMIRVADLLRERGEYKRAAELAERSLEIRRSELGRLHADVADSLNMVGILRQAQGRMKESEAAFQEAVDIRRRTQPGSTLLALSLGNLGNLVKDHDPAAAEKLYREALALRKKNWGDEHPRVASSLGQIADTLLAQGHAAGALEATTEAVGILRKNLPVGHPEIARTLLAHASALRQNGRLEEAAAVAREALEIHQKARGPESPEATMAQSSLARVYLASGRLTDAEALLRQCVATRRKVLGGAHRLTARALDELADVREKQGDAIEANALRTEAKAIRAPK